MNYRNEDGEPEGIPKPPQCFAGDGDGRGVQEQLLCAGLIFPCDGTVAGSSSAAYCFTATNFPPPPPIPFPVA